ncbi:MAG: ThuA domain-containing protein [Acidimicrobiales bacterium]
MTVPVLLVTKGHPFEREAFLAMFDHLVETGLITYEHVEHPDVEARLHPDRLAPAEVVVFYDMPGLHFTRAEPPLAVVEPSDEYVAGFEALLAAGTGMLFLHHAMASWPSWARYAEVVGARFLYQPGDLWGRPWPDSGYLLDVEHTVEVVAPDHPVCAGLPPSFALRDELYLTPPVLPDVTPLLRTTHPMTDDRFFSADEAIRGRRHSRDGWSHPAGPDLIGWTHVVERSRVVYLQPGDGPSSYADPHVRRLLANSIAFVASGAVSR